MAILRPFCGHSVHHFFIFTSDIGQVSSASVHLIGLFKPNLLLFLLSFFYTLLYFRWTCACSDLIFTQSDQIGKYLCFWLTILNDWEICNFAFCVWDYYYYIEIRAVWVVFSCLNVVRAHLLSVLMAIIFLSRLRPRRAITSGSTPFMENDLANVSLYAMPL